MLVEPNVTLPGHGAFVQPLAGAFAGSNLLPQLWPIVISLSSSCADTTISMSPFTWWYVHFGEP